MDYKDVDALFLLATQGNKIAFNRLYEEYIRQARIITVGILRNLPKKINVEIGQIEVQLYELFIKMLINFDFGRGTFSAYMRFNLQKKINHEIKKEIAELSKILYSLDEIVEDIGPKVELLTYPDDKTIEQQIAEKDFKFYMASPNKSKDKNNLNKEVTRMLYLGYKKEEIAEKLKTTVGKVRYAQEKSKDEKEISNFNLEMK